MGNTQKIIKNLTKFGSGHYVLIPKSEIEGWCKRLAVKAITKVLLILRPRYIEIRPLKEK